MSLPSSASDEPMVCEDIFSLNGLNYTTFYLGAAHGLHSLSLEEIRYFFDENATEAEELIEAEQMTKQVAMTTNRD